MNVGTHSLVAELILLHISNHARPAVAKIFHSSKDIDSVFVFQPFHKVGNCAVHTASAGTVATKKQKKTNTRINYLVCLVSKLKRIYILLSAEK